MVLVLYNIMVVQPLVILLYTNCLPANEYSIVLTDNKGEGEGGGEGEGEGEGEVEGVG